jgi:hypothetical protein
VGVHACGGDAEIERDLFRRASGSDRGEDLALTVGQAA